MGARIKSALARLLESFFFKRLMAQLRASPATIAAYRDALRLFITFASKRVDRAPSLLALEELDRDLVLEFLDHLERERRNSIRTRNLRLSAIRSFYQHVAYSDPAAMGLASRVLSIPSKRTTKRLLGYLPVPELDAILGAPDRSTPLGRRDHALLLFLGRTGARVSEATAVDVADLELQKPSSVLFRGKRRKERVVPIDDDVAAVLNALIEERGVSKDPRSPVFVNRRGQRLTRHGVMYILRRTVTIATKSSPTLAKKRISPHTLRHTTGMHLLQSGVDLTTIQAWLGHASTDTTHQYVEADLEMKRRALEKCSFTQAKPAIYQPPDEVLAMLDRLEIYGKQPET